MNADRENKFRSVIKCRQPNLTVILENVHDAHNIGAVMRTCDSVGIKEIFVLYSRPELANEEKLYLGKRTSAGARKWVDVHFYTDTTACFEHVKRNYEKVFCTHLAEDAVSIYDLDLTTSIALLFGNEHMGVTEKALEYCDGNFLIPQVGMVESLNISVACAVSLYEAFRQRKSKGFYDDNALLSEQEQAELFALYEQRHIHKHKPKTVYKQNG